MKIYFTLILILFVHTVSGQEFTNLYGDYLGQAPPGDTPVVFAPGIVSTNDLEHSHVVVSPDGNEIFWNVNQRPETNNNHWISFTKTMRRINGRWTDPDVSPLSYPYFSIE